MAIGSMLSVAVFAFLPAAVVAWGGPLLTLPYATYEGNYSSTSDVNSWYGIRYAQAVRVPLSTGMLYTQVKWHRNSP